jgi:hypothetical protein
MRGRAAADRVPHRTSHRRQGLVSLRHRPYSGKRLNSATIAIFCSVTARRPSALACATAMRRRTASCRLMDLATTSGDGAGFLRNAIIFAVIRRRLRENISHRTIAAQQQSRDSIRLTKPNVCQKRRALTRVYGSVVVRSVLCEGSSGGHAPIVLSCCQTGLQS